MNARSIALALFLLFVGVQSNNNTFYPVAIAANNHEYVAFGSYLFVFDFEGLNLTQSQNYSQNIISYPPISFDNSTLHLGDGLQGSYEIDDETLELTQRADRVAPEGQPIAGSLGFLQSQYCVQDANNSSFCFQAGNPATITKTDVEGVNTTVTLGNYTSSRFLKVEEDSGLLHLTAEVILGRGGLDMDYWTFNLTGDFQIKTGPVTLNNTYISGCPVAPRGCGVAVLMYMDVYNGTVVYLWTIANSETFAYEIHLVTYNAENGFVETFFDDSTYTPSLVNSKGPETTAPVEDNSTTEVPSPVVEERDI